MSGEGPLVVVVRGDAHGGSPAAAWTAGFPARELAPEELAGGDAAAREALQGAECALLDAASLDALAVARLVHRADPELQVVIVVPNEEARRAIQRAIVFTPGIGEVWLASPVDVAGAIAERAAGVTRQRRSYRRARARMKSEAVLRSPQQAERAMISDAYLADLLQVTPDPVFSVNASGLVLSANPASRELLDAPHRAPGPLALEDLVKAPDGTTITDLLRRSERGTARVEVEFTRRDGESGFGELLASHVARSDPP